MPKSGGFCHACRYEDFQQRRRTMRLIFATIVAAATLTTLSTPVFADGERGRGHYDNRGHGDSDNNRNGRHYQPYDRGPVNRPYVQPGGPLDDGPAPSWYRPDHDNRGARYWGPSARPWSRWDNSWGDPNRYARQWGFDRYDHNRGWQRGNTWYSTPNQWSDWGGWNWSFSVGNGGYNNGYNNGGYYQQNANCSIYRTQDWVNGRRAIVTYTGCADRWGRVYEQPGTRRIESWGW
jgi:hypothetical protein